MTTVIAELHLAKFGHFLGWTQNLVDFLNENPDQHQYVYLLNPSSKSFFKPEIKNPNLSIVYIEDHEESSILAEKSLIKQAKLEFDLIHGFCSKLGADKLILMGFDTYQVTLGLRKLNYTVSGIWFKPTYRTVVSSLKEKFQVFRKNLTIRWCLLNPKINQIFILNDQKAADSYNQNYRNVFRYLPDPTFDYTLKDISIRDLHKISGDKVMFLIFGAIDDRKNVINILRAFDALPKPDQSKAVLLIIGKTRDTFKTDFYNELKKIALSSPELTICHEDRFIDDSEMDTYFAQCDVVLRMNVNFYASSGIVGNAAKFDKALLVSDYGLVAEQVIDQNLGLLADPDNVAEIKQCLQDFIEKPEIRKVNGQPFYEAHDRDHTFRELLFSNH